MVWLADTVLDSFAVYRNGFLVIWYASIPENADFVAMLFPLRHVTVGVGLTHYVIAGWVNRTHIFASHGKIAVRHKALMGRSTDAQKHAPLTANVSAAR